MERRRVGLIAAVLAAGFFQLGLAQGDAGDGSLRKTLAANLGAGPLRAVEEAKKAFPDDRAALDVVADWMAQDGIDGATLDVQAVVDVVDSLGPDAETLRIQLDSLRQSGVETTDARWGELYLSACEMRRAARLAPYREKLRRIVFTKHYDLGGSHYAYTEGQSDAQAERHFTPGTALCVLEMNDLYGTVRTLVDDPDGVIRDPDVSYDGQRILFAWKKSLDEDDYHLYELNAADGQVRQITSGLGWADYEGAYLPSGEIIFNSTRCMQIVDCFWTEVSNLFVCDGDGRHMRQLSYDQVHDNYPTVTDDGRIIYTRWDYNDRGQIFPQGLFQTNQDGTGQTELYGNNSWFPTTILHARAIPGTGKIVCVFSGHHSRQKGQLGILNPRKGRQENQGAQLIAPIRETPAVHVDSYGQQGDQFQYPYPLCETAFLVTFRTEKAPWFGIYFMTIDGQRELLASDPKTSCNQPVPLAARPIPIQRANLVDYRKKTGTVYLQDVYAGPGLAGIERGTIKSLRVIALEFRAAGIGSNGNSGPAGGAMASTPISIQGAWDVKKVLGTTPVHDDGSACFVVPARTPVYFQALDEKGHMVQTMRSWVSLQPGESVSCVGCHENKNTAPPVTRFTEAMAVGPQRIEPFYGPPRGFSFIKEVQPILDKHCVRCHHLDKEPDFVKADAYTGNQAFDPGKMHFLAECRGVQWRYTLEKPAENWTDPEFDDSAWAYGPGGFGCQGTPGAAIGTNWHTKQIWIRRSFDLPEDVKLLLPTFLVHHDEDVAIYLNGVLAAAAKGHVGKYGRMTIRPAALKTLRPGKNTLAVSCKQTGGGQFVDVGIIDVKSDETLVATDTNASLPEGIKPAFSLRGRQTLDRGAQRKWSDSYRALANRNVANWVNIQSAPPMLPPYHAGASQSKLIRMLEEGHNGVELSGAELDRFVTWIDLLVPYVGDFTEAMAEDRIPHYNKYLDKRRQWQAEEAANIAEYLGQ